MITVLVCVAIGVLVLLVAAAVAPVPLVRLLCVLYWSGDPRRDELVAEIQSVGDQARIAWALDQLEVVVRNAPHSWRVRPRQRERSAWRAGIALGIGQGAVILGAAFVAQIAGGGVLASVLVTITMMVLVTAICWAFLQTLVRPVRGCNREAY